MHKAKHRRSRTSIFSFNNPRVRVRNGRHSTGNPDGKQLTSLGIEVELYRATAFRLN